MDNKFLKKEEICKQISSFFCYYLKIWIKTLDFSWVKGMWYTK